MPDTTPAQRTAVATEKTAENTDPASQIEVAAARADMPAPATTTAEEDRGAASIRDSRVTQRAEAATVAKTRADRQNRINSIWEYTQSYVASIVVTVTALAIFIGRVVQHDVVPFPAEWWTIVGLVIGFYFGRTNHARIGDEPRSPRAGDLDDR